MYLVNNTNCARFSWGRPFPLSCQRNEKYWTWTLNVTCRKLVRCVIAEEYRMQGVGFEAKCSRHKVRLEKWQDIWFDCDNQTKDTIIRSFLFVLLINYRREFSWQIIYVLISTKMNGGSGHDDDDDGGSCCTQ